MRPWVRINRGLPMLPRESKDFTERGIVPKYVDEDGFFLKQAKEQESEKRSVAEYMRDMRKARDEFVKWLREGGSFK